MKKLLKSVLPQRLIEQVGDIKSLFVKKQKKLLSMWRRFDCEIYL
jgi:hypothetical protein